MKKFFATLVLVCGFATLAHAQGDGPCAADREKFCGKIEKGDGRVMKCMMEHKDQLSAECKAQHEKMKEHMKDVKEACHDDVEKFCGTVEHGKGRVMKCMREHKEELSAGCKAEMESKKEMRRKAKK